MRDTSRPHKKRAKRRIAVFPRATSYKLLAGFGTPTPTLPQGEGALPDTKRKLRASCQLQNYGPRATGYLPPFPDSPDEADWPGRDPGPMPEEKPGLCICPTSTLERRGFQSFPYGRAPKTELAVSTGHRPRATGHPITTYYVPRTTYPQGGHTGPPLRRNNTRHES